MVGDATTVAALGDLQPIGPDTRFPSIHASVEDLACPAHNSSLAAAAGQVDPLSAEVCLLLEDTSTATNQP
jgi:hypothetical protein